MAAKTKENMTRRLVYGKKVLQREIKVGLLVLSSRAGRPKVEGPGCKGSLMKITIKPQPAK